ncbi:uncharacterized protein [Mytilus edulis]|uniref:uncharacterized protein n=1 Tax=Mytilus edulis TaxID=6550 RepID=UPI0039F02913
MKFEYLILSPLLCIVANDGQGSCLNSCGQVYNSSLPCQCNWACTKFKNCCNDYNDSCPKELCVDSCGQPFNITHRCQCNKECKTYNNCCDDYDTFCLLRVNDSSTTEYTRSDTTFITSVYNESNTEENSSGIIAGVTVSLAVVVLIVVVILALVYRKIRLRKQLLSQTVVNGKRTSKMNYYVTDNVQEDQYHDIDIANGDYCLAAAISDDTANIEGNEDGDTTYVRAISGVYDELNGKDKRKIPTKYQNENTSKLERSKMEMYTLTSNLTVNQQTQDNNSSVKWQTPDAEDFDPTYNHSNNVIVREDLSNYDHFSNQ